MLYLSRLLELGLHLWTKWASVLGVVRLGGLRDFGLRMADFGLNLCSLNVYLCHAIPNLKSVSFFLSSETTRPMFLNKKQNFDTFLMLYSK